MEWILNYFTFEQILIIAIGVILLISLVLQITHRSQLKRLKDKYNRFMKGTDGVNIEFLLQENLERSKKIDEKINEMESHFNSIDRSLLNCIQKIGIVRFNAFENTGSDLSFSIVLMDNNDNGFLLSGIYTRDSSSTYAKPIDSGKSKYPLSAEEIKAIDIAKKTHREKYYGR